MLRVIMARVCARAAPPPSFAAPAFIYAAALRALRLSAVAYACHQVHMNTATMPPAAREDYFDDIAVPPRPDGLLPY